MVADEAGSGTVVGGAAPVLIDSTNSTARRRASGVGFRGASAVPSEYAE